MREETLPDFEEMFGKTIESIEGDPNEIRIKVLKEFMLPYVEQ